MYYRNHDGRIRVEIDNIDLYNDPVPANINLKLKAHAESKLINHLESTNFDLLFDPSRHARYKAHISMLMANTLFAMSSCGNSDGTLRISCDKNNYIVSNPGNPQKITMHFLKPLIKEMREHNYYCKWGGNFNRVKNTKGVQTRLIPTGTLKMLIQDMRFTLDDVEYHPDTELVVLRDSDKKNILYQENDVSLNRRKINETYNLFHQSIDLKMSDGESLLSPRLHSVFNNSSFDQGGRYYGAFQNIEKNKRKFLRINGEPLCELDYRAYQIAIMNNIYGNKALFEDPYDIIEYLEGVRQELDDDFLRKLVKKALHTMLNAESKSAAEASIRSEILKCKCKSIKAKNIMAALEKKHLLISKLFYSGIGIFLQYIDSEITGAVISHFVRRGIPILPIHDSFLVYRHKAKELEQVMKDSYCQVLMEFYNIEVNPPEVDYVEV